jgi:hypothetical protein
MFERSLRHTVILFEDPLTLAIQHPLLPLLAGLGLYAGWRGIRARAVAGNVLSSASEE